VYEHPVTRRVVPSITAINATIDKSALKFWAARQAAEYAVAQWPTLATLEPAQRVDLIKNAPWRTSGKAADEGSLVHGWIDRFIKGKQLVMNRAFDAEVAAASITARRMWRSFGAFCDHYGPKWLDAEFTVWSDTHGYAGTMDWSARIGQWLVLGDTKTGKGVYPEVGLQIAAGAYADYIIEPDGTQRPIPAFDKFAVLHVRPTYTTLHPLAHIDECFQAFIAARTLKNWKDEVSEHIVEEAPRVSIQLKEAA
jgi:hypothetical protein